MSHPYESCRRAVSTAVLSLAAVTAQGASIPEADYPSRPIRLVVPFAAGGPADRVARAIAPALAKSLGQPMVVENRAGAEGAIGAQSVQASPPDGYTLLVAGGSLVPLVLMKKAPPFDLRADFVPISKVAPSPYAMYVSTQVPATTVAAFVAHARAHPGQLNVATSTLNDFMAAARFMKATGTTMTQVPYKGAGQAMPDLLAGRVQVNFSPVSATGIQQVRAGQLRMLAVLSSQRSALVPDIPTMSEAGVSGVEVPGWLGLFAPAKTPREIVDRLNGAMKDSLAAPDVRAELEKQSVQAEGSTPQALAALLDDDLQAWQAFIREHGLVPE